MMRDGKPRPRIHHHDARRRNALVRSGVRDPAVLKFVREYALNAGASEGQAEATVRAWVRLNAVERGAALREMRKRYSEQLEASPARERLLRARRAQSVEAVELFCPQCNGPITEAKVEQLDGLCSEDCHAKAIEPGGEHE